MHWSLSTSRLSLWRIETAHNLELAPAERAAEHGCAGFGTRRAGSDIVKTSYTVTSADLPINNLQAVLWRVKLTKSDGVADGIANGTVDYSDFSATKSFLR
jgi:hypothetical protein